MIDQKNYTGGIVQCYGMRGCNPAYTPGVRPELSLDQPEENLLNEPGSRLRLFIVMQVQRSYISPLDGWMSQFYLPTHFLTLSAIANQNKTNRPVKIRTHKIFIKLRGYPLLYQGGEYGIWS